MADDIDPKAPHGRDDEGVPLAPYGYKQDGTPRLSNRGRSAGKSAPAPQKKAEKNKAAAPAPGTPASQKRALIDLVDTLLTPVALAATNPVVERKMGEQKACAVAGSVIIVQAHLDPLADAVVGLAADRPGMLSWLERADDAMPYMALLKVGGQLAKALYSNFRDPNPRLARAAAKYGNLRVMQFAEQVEQEAEAYGVTDDAIEQVRAQQMAMAHDVPVRQEPTEENGWVEYSDPWMAEAV